MKVAHENQREDFTSPLRYRCSQSISDEFQIAEAVVEQQLVLYCNEYCQYNKPPFTYILQQLLHNCTVRYYC